MEKEFNGNKMELRESIQERVRAAVTLYLDRNAISAKIPYNIIVDTESRDHVISIGTSIMMNKIGMETNPGGFVEAILQNDLYGAFSRADNINSQVLGFYLAMMGGISIPVTQKEISDSK